ncbi:MAG: hypothetical protein SGILL_006019 [Bacillariaceae sp.]
MTSSFSSGGGDYVKSRPTDTRKSMPLNSISMLLKLLFVVVLVAITLPSSYITIFQPAMAAAPQATVPWTKRRHNPSSAPSKSTSTKSFPHIPRAGALSASDAAIQPLSYYLRVALAGGVAGATGSAVLFPLDSAKTLRQTEPSTYKSVQDALVQMLQSKNCVSRLYRGIVPAAVGAIPSSALYFGAYESCKVTLERMWVLPKDGNKKNDDKSSTRRRLTIHALAAASGNIISSTVFVPKEVIKQQLQYHAQEQLQGTTTSVMSVVRDKGITGLYAGYGATLMRNIPSAMMRFVLYEELKRKFGNGGNGGNGSNSNNNNSLQGSWGTFLAGAVSGSTASFVMTPMDVLKSRQATGTCPLGVRNCMMHVIKSTGVKGLYAGAGSRMLWSGAFSAIGFGTFEYVKGRLGVSDDGMNECSTRSERKNSS